MSKINAILLIGPTGSGKTPLGDYLEQKGVNGKRCFHFDFGACLRGIASAGACGSMSDWDITVVRDSLTKGVLLENENFHIAEKVLSAFCADHSVGADDILLMNGLPRHIGQAAGVDKHVNIMRVVNLECSATVVMERIRLDTGGDREERIDDSLDYITKKLETFNSRTLPVIDHYKFVGSDVVSIRIAVDSTAEQIAELIPAL